MSTIKMKVYGVRFNNGRVVILGDSGQNDDENLIEINELVSNMRSGNQKLIPVEHITMEIEVPC
jgi:hypothetical protein